MSDVIKEEYAKRKRFTVITLDEHRDMQPFRVLASDARKAERLVAENLEADRFIVATFSGYIEAE